jgi:hypothetical protein
MFCWFAHRLNASVSARNFLFYFFVEHFKFDGVNFLGLNRSEKKLLGKFPSYFEMIQKMNSKLKKLEFFWIILGFGG